MLNIENISKSFLRKGETIRAVENFSTTVRSGKITTIQGASGSGKTTLLLMAAGLLRPDAGTVKLSGNSLYEMNPKERASLRSQQIGVVFQQFHLMPYLSVMDNILVPAWVTKQSLNESAQRLIAEFGLTDRVDHKPSELSVGERQRVALARALILNPSLIIADEPTANLDRDNAEIVLQALSRFAKTGKSVLMASHDPRIADFADHTIFLATKERKEHKNSGAGFFNR